jgi:hypothetical protein
MFAICISTNVSKMIAHSQHSLKAKSMHQAAYQGHAFFSNEDACLRLTLAGPMQFSENWEFRKICLNEENKQAILSGKNP